MLSYYQLFSHIILSVFHKLVVDFVDYQEAWFLDLSVCKLSVCIFCQHYVDQRRCKVF